MQRDADRTTRLIRRLVSNDLSANEEADLVRLLRTHPIIDAALVNEVKDASEHSLSHKIMLGLLYWSGCGVEENYQYAMALFQEAHKAGTYRYAMLVATQIGHMHYNGHGTPLNYETAYTWFMKAASSGYQTGQYNVGICYLNGFGMPQDLVQAALWFRRALLSGSPNAKFRLAEIRAQDFAAVIPYGDWEPRLHYLCNDVIRRDIMITFMIGRRVKLPRNLIVANLIPFVCCWPRPFVLTIEMQLAMLSVRLEETRKEQARINAKLDKILEQTLRL